MAFISSHFYYSVDYYIINFENHCKWNEDFFSNICFTTPHRTGWNFRRSNSTGLKKLTESYVVSNQKLKTALGIEKMPVTAEEGLKRTLASFGDKTQHQEPPEPPEHK